MSRLTDSNASRSVIVSVGSTACSTRPSSNPPTTQFNPPFAVGCNSFPVTRLESAPGESSEARHTCDLRVRTIRLSVVSDSSSSATRRVPTRSSARRNGSTTLTVRDISVLDESTDRLLACGRSQRGCLFGGVVSPRQRARGVKGKYEHAYPTDPPADNSRDSCTADRIRRRGAGPGRSSRGLRYPHGHPVDGPDKRSERHGHGLRFG